MGLRLRLAPFLFLILGLSLDASAKPPCFSLLQENYGGSTLKIISVSDIPLHLKDGVYHFNSTSIFPNTSEVLLGIQHDGHAFLTVGDVRYDGDISPLLGKVRTTNGWHQISTLIRFKGMSITSQRTLYNHLRGLSGNALYSTSCFHGVCQRLQHVGVQLATAQGNQLPQRASDILSAILTRGFVDGNRSPVSVEIYRTNTTRLDEIYGRVYRKEEVIRHRLGRNPASDPYQPATLYTFAAGSDVYWVWTPETPTP